jgi:hypothetical protein
MPYVSMTSSDSVIAKLRARSLGDEFTDHAFRVKEVK